LARSLIAPPWVHAGWARELAGRQVRRWYAGKQVRPARTRVISSCRLAGGWMAVGAGAGGRLGLNSGTRAGARLEPPWSRVASDPEKPACGCWHLEAAQFCASLGCGRGRNRAGPGAVYMPRAPGRKKGHLPRRGSGTYAKCSLTHGAYHRTVAKQVAWRGPKHHNGEMLLRYAVNQTARRRHRIARARVQGVYPAAGQCGLIELAVADLRSHLWSPVVARRAGE
jgi:hypothetical protein